MKQKEATVNINEASDPETKTKSKTLFYRLVVTVIFLTSLSMCIYQTHELIMLFLSDPIETHIQVRVNNIMEFPAITICNLNPVRRTRWEQKLNESDTAGTKQVRLKQDMKEDRPKRQTAENSKHFHKIIAIDSFDRAKGTFESVIVKSRKQNRFKRQGFLEDLSALRVMVESNRASILTLANQQDTTSNKNIYFQSNITSLWTSVNNSLASLEHLENTIQDLAARVSVAELTTAQITQEMENTKSYLEFLRANISNPLEFQENRTMKESENVKELVPSKDTEAFHDYLKNIGSMKREDIHVLGHQKEDFIAICSWKGGICHPSHFETFQNFMYGNCFTFNTSQVDAHVTGTGPYNGLSLSLFIEQNEYIDRVAPAAGARVIIHDHNHKPFPDEQGFSVAPGYTTAVFLRKSTTQTVKPICDPEIETSYELNGRKCQYSQKSCLKQCLSDEILHQCHCASSKFLLDLNTCSPDNQKEVDCVERLERLAGENKLPCYCPTSCRTTTYNPMISSSSWPAEKYLPSLLEELVRVKHKVLDKSENITDYAQYFRKHFLRIEIFFQELTEQEIIQRYSYGIESLLSDIGGQLGLWIGVSAATLVESMKTITVLASSFLQWIKSSRLKRTLPLGRRQPVMEPSDLYETEKRQNISRSTIISIPHGGLENTSSRTSSKFLHVNFEHNIS